VLRAGANAVDESVTWWTMDMPVQSSSMSHGPISTLLLPRDATLALYMLSSCVRLCESTSFQKLRRIHQVAVPSICHHGTTVGGEMSFRRATPCWASCEHTWQLRWDLCSVCVCVCVWWDVAARDHMTSCFVLPVWLLRWTDAASISSWEHHVSHTHTHTQQSMSCDHYSFILLYALPSLTKKTIPYSL